eukprot:scpid64190/ scgid5890/ Pseudouridylate synthase 7 homolog-like protein
MDVQTSLSLYRFSRFGLDLTPAAQPSVSYGLKTSGNGSDFIVVEENLRGERASVECQKVPKRSTLTRSGHDCTSISEGRNDVCRPDSIDGAPSHAKRRKVESNSCSGDTEYNGWNSGNSRVCWTVLRKLVAEECLRDLVRLATLAVRSMHNRTNSQDADGQNVDYEPGLKTRVVLRKCRDGGSGSTGNDMLDGKLYRTMVHRCVRTVFPQLATRTDQSTDPDAIMVTIDPCFNALCCACKSTTDALCILWFHHSNCYRPTLAKNEQTLDVCVGIEREQRAAIHHTIRQHFGKSLESKTRQNCAAAAAAASPASPTVCHPAASALLLPCEYDQLPMTTSPCEDPTHPDKCDPCFTTTHEQSRKQQQQESREHEPRPQQERQPVDLATDSRELQQSCIQVRYRSRPSSAKYSKQSDVTYLHFALEKRNMETLAALRLLTVSLGVRLCDFAYAGTKDCQARTCQFVSLKNGRAEELRALADYLSTKNIRTGSYSYHPAPLALGDLCGNHFEIIAHNLTSSCHSTSSSPPHDAMPTQDLMSSLASRAASSQQPSYHLPVKTCAETTALAPASTTALPGTGIATAAATRETTSATAGPTPGEAMPKVVSTSVSTLPPCDSGSSRTTSSSAGDGSNNSSDGSDGDGTNNSSGGGGTNN